MTVQDLHNNSLRSTLVALDRITRFRRTGGDRGHHCHRLLTEYWDNLDSLKLMNGSDKILSDLALMSANLVGQLHLRSAASQASHRLRRPRRGQSVILLRITCAWNHASPHSGADPAAAAAWTDPNKRRTMTVRPRAPIQPHLRTLFRDLRGRRWLRELGPPAQAGSAALHLGHR